MDSPGSGSSPHGLATFLRLRDQWCRTPWCNAPNLTQRPRDRRRVAGGPTSAESGQGLCESCNYAKQADGWQHRPRPGPDGHGVDNHHSPPATPTPRDRHRSRRSGRRDVPGPPGRLRPDRVIVHWPTAATTIWWGRRGYGRDMAIDAVAPDDLDWMVELLQCAVGRRSCRTHPSSGGRLPTRTPATAHTSATSSPRPERGRGARRRPCSSPQVGAKVGSSTTSWSATGSGQPTDASSGTPSPPTAGARTCGSSVRRTTSSGATCAVAASLVVSESWWLIELEGVGGGEAGVRVTSPASRRSPSRHHRCTRHLAPRYSCHHRPMSLQR